MEKSIANPALRAIILGHCAAGATFGRSDATSPLAGRAAARWRYVEVTSSYPSRPGPSPASLSLGGADTP
jgi:hypothetical protein